MRTTKDLNPTTQATEVIINNNTEIRASFVRWTDISGIFPECHTDEDFLHEYNRRLAENPDRMAKTCFDFALLAEYLAELHYQKRALTGNPNRDENINSYLHYIVIAARYYFLAVQQSYEPAGQQLSGLVGSLKINRILIFVGWNKSFGEVFNYQAQASAAINDKDSIHTLDTVMWYKLAACYGNLPAVKYLLSLQPHQLTPGINISKIISSVIKKLQAARQYGCICNTAAIALAEIHLSRNDVNLAVDQLMAALPDPAVAEKMVNIINEHAANEDMWKTVIFCPLPNLEEANRAKLQELFNQEKLKLAAILSTPAASDRYQLFIESLPCATFARTLKKRYTASELGESLQAELDQHLLLVRQIEASAVEANVLNKEQKVRLILMNAASLWPNEKDLPASVKKLQHGFAQPIAPSDEEIKKELSDKLTFSLMTGRKALAVIFYNGVVCYEELLTELLSRIYALAGHKEDDYKNKIEELKGKLDRTVWEPESINKIQEIKSYLQEGNIISLFFAKKPAISYSATRDEIWACMLSQLHDNKKSYTSDYIDLCQFIFGDWIVGYFPSSFHETDEKNDGMMVLQHGGELTKFQAARLLLKYANKFWPKEDLPDGVEKLQKLFDRSSVPREKDIEEILTKKLDFSLNGRQEITIIFYFAMIFYPKLLGLFLTLLFDEKKLADFEGACKDEIDKIQLKIEAMTMPLDPAVLAMRSYISEFEQNKPNDVNIAAFAKQQPFTANATISRYLSRPYTSAWLSILAYTLMQLKDPKKIHDDQCIELYQYIANSIKPYQLIAHKDAVDSFPSLYRSVQMQKTKLSRLIELQPGVLPRTAAEREAETLFLQAKAGNAEDAEDAAENLLNLAKTECRNVSINREAKTYIEQYQFAIVWYAMMYCCQQNHQTLVVYYCKQMARHGYVPAIHFLKVLHDNDLVKQCEIDAILMVLKTAAECGEPSVHLACGHIFAAELDKNQNKLSNTMTFIQDKPDQVKNCGEYAANHFIRALYYPDAAEALVHLIQQKNPAAMKTVRAWMYNDLAKPAPSFCDIFTGERNKLFNLPDDAPIDINGFFWRIRELRDLGHILREELASRPADKAAFDRYEETVKAFAKDRFVHGLLTDDEKIRWVLEYCKDIWSDGLTLPDSVKKLDYLFFNKERHPPTQKEIEELLAEKLQLGRGRQYQTIVFYYAMFKCRKLLDYFLDSLFGITNANSYFLRIAEIKGKIDSSSASPIQNADSHKKINELQSVIKVVQGEQLLGIVSEPLFQWYQILYYLLTQLHARGPHFGEYIALCKQILGDEVVDTFLVVPERIEPVDVLQDVEAASSLNARAGHQFFVYNATQKTTTFVNKDEENKDEEKKEEEKADEYDFVLIKK
ncbi:MAG TPA: hypothetical protein VHZ76_06405 [Gammaproteobacteria bacterium]|nr:hypothetical protein [Gammaproteobacteria bacterium]